MAPVHDENIPADLPRRVDSALQALWHGDSAEFDRLLDSEGDLGPGIGELLQGVIGRPPAPVTARPPSQIDGYTIIQELGRGGMGVVYEAEQAEPRRRVALKLLAGPCADQHHVKLFRREIQTLARLEHPAIATIYDAGHTAEGQHFFTMELARGHPTGPPVPKAAIGAGDQDL
jgi:serine/threonine protein kinase